MNTLYTGYTKLIMALIIITGFFACRKTDYTNALQSTSKKINGILADPDTPAVYNYVMISSGQVADFADSNYAITANAAFTDSPSRAIRAVNSLSVNSQLLGSNSLDNTYYFNFSDTSSVGGLLRPALTTFAALSLPGSVYKVHIAGSSAADTLTQNVYLPKNLLRHAVDFPGAKLEISNNLVLNWVPDANNIIGTVAILVVYDSAMSQFNDSALTSPIAPLSYMVPDNGTYTIPASALQVFPAKGYVSIILARATQYLAVLPVSRKTVYFWGTCTLNTPPLLVSPCGAACSAPSHKCINGICVAGSYTILSRQSSPTQCITVYGYVFPDGTAQYDHTVVISGPCS